MVKLCGKETSQVRWERRPNQDDSHTRGFWGQRKALFPWREDTQIFTITFILYSYISCIILHVLELKTCTTRPGSTVLRIVQEDLSSRPTSKQDSASDSPFLWWKTISVIAAKYRRGKDIEQLSSDRGVLYQGNAIMVRCCISSLFRKTTCVREGMGSLDPQSLPAFWWKLIPAALKSKSIISLIGQIQNY